MPWKADRLPRKNRSVQKNRAMYRQESEEACLYEAPTPNKRASPQVSKPSAVADAEDVLVLLDQLLVLQRQINSQPESGEALRQQRYDVLFKYILAIGS